MMAASLVNSPMTRAGNRDITAKRTTMTMRPARMATEAIFFMAAVSRFPQYWDARITILSPIPMRIF